jgi:hypothetical protein
LISQGCAGWRGCWPAAAAAVLGYHQGRITARLNAMQLPKMSIHFEDATEPLRLRVPTHDEDGRPLSDFMVLIPGLREKPRHVIDATIQDVHLILTHFRHAVVFAEFNIRLNLLWVSIKPIHRIRFEITGAIQEQVPEARLISHI